MRILRYLEIWNFEIKFPEFGSTIAPNLKREPRKCSASCISVGICRRRGAIPLLTFYQASLEAHTEAGCTARSGKLLEGSFSAVSKPNFASIFSFESSRRDSFRDVSSARRVRKRYSLRPSGAEIRVPQKRKNIEKSRGLVHATQ